jgi:ribosome-binding ATPase YchF (GTP1/OBG family)
LKKKLADAAIQLAKKAQAAGEISQKIQQVSQSTENASKELGKFLDMAKNLAEDKELFDEELSDEELSDEELHEKARISLLEELSKMAIYAANNSDYKTAYKIERAYDSIFYNEE